MCGCGKMIDVAKQRSCYRTKTGYFPPSSTFWSVLFLLYGSKLPMRTVFVFFFKFTIDWHDSFYPSEVDQRCKTPANLIYCIQQRIRYKQSFPSPTTSSSLLLEFNRTKKKKPTDVQLCVWHWRLLTKQTPNTSPEKNAFHTPFHNFSSCYYGKRNTLERVQ